MNDKRRAQLVSISLFSIFIGLSIPTALAQGTAFNYQGKLTDGGAPANGTYDFQFALFEGLAGGTQIGSTLTRSNVSVSNGGFAATLDFGVNAFPGADRFLEVSVRPNGGGSFTTLAPRQQISSTPYALRTLSAGTADALSSGCVGCVQDGQINSLSGSKVSGTIPVASVPAGSSNYLQNTTNQQANTNFNISGNGTAGGTLSANSVNSVTQYNLNGLRAFTVNGMYSDCCTSVTASNTFTGDGAGLNTSPSGSLTDVIGKFNSFYGAKAGQTNTDGFLNSSFGGFAGQMNTTGNENAFFGASAGAANTTGASNAFFGYSAGITNVSGTNNTLVGNMADVGSGNLNYSTAIGANATVNCSHCMVLGNPADSSLKVGIGTSTPNTRLEVQAGGNVGIFSTSDSIAMSGFGTRVGVNGSTNTGTGVVGNANSAGGIAVNGNGTSWFQGDTTPLPVTAARGIAIGFSQAVGNTVGYIYAFDYTNFQPQTLALNHGGGRVGIGTTTPDQTLSVNGNASKPGGGSWLAFSDERLKHIKGRFTPGLQAVLRLQPVRYEYKRDNALGLRAEGEQIGFSAQAVQKLIPEAVSQNDKGYLLVNNDPILWAMLNAIKEQQAQIKRQQNEIKGLKKLICQTHPKAAVCKRRR